MFETNLVASRKTAVLGNPKLLPLAVLAHGLLLAGVVTATYWNVEELAEPELMQTLQITLPPPPMEAPPAAPEPPAPQPPSRPATAPTPQPPTVEAPPVTLEDIPPTPPVPDLPVTSTFPGPVTTDSTEPGPGCPGCGGIGPAGGGGGEILRPGGAVSAPTILERVLPKYTEAARRARVEGTVILEAIIGADGGVHGVRVLKSLPMGLDQEAIKAVEGWKFRPGRRGEQAVNVYFTLTVRFELQ